MADRRNRDNIIKKFLSITDKGDKDFSRQTIKELLNIMTDELNLK
jgi:hypothetical protein